MRRLVVLSHPLRNLAVSGILFWGIVTAFVAAGQNEDHRFADSSDFVRVVGVARAPDQQSAVVTLSVDSGYHINANPASEPYLIPTSLTFKGSAPARVLYPSPVRFKPVFSDESLDVYEGIVSISASFPTGALEHIPALQGAVTVQACSDRICFPPADLAFSERLVQGRE